MNNWRLTNCNNNVNKIADSSYWKKLADEDMIDAFTTKRNEGVAKNIILFVGDGMGPSTVTTARIYAKGESGYLAFEKFPHIGALKVYITQKNSKQFLL